jgi:hypothetical protein
MTAAAATATTPSATAAPRPLTRRLANVVRLLLANPFTIFFTPLLILGLIFLVNWVIWWLIWLAAPTDTQSIEDVSVGFQYSGASLWIFVYMMVVAIQAMNLSFPFALGFGSTRRDFSLGSAVTFTGLSVLYALIFMTLAAIETATNGWGLRGAMFNSLYFDTSASWGTRLFHVFAGFVFFFAIGSVFGAVYVRWRGRGLILFFAALTLVLVGGAAVLTLTERWGVIGDFFVTIGFTGGFTLGLAIAVVAGLAGHFVLRRATPRS